MLGLNTITLISSRVGSFIKRIVTDGLKMRLPFTSAEHLGRESVTDNSFNDTNEWVKENGWVVSSGLATRTDVDSYTALQQNCLVSGKTYTVTIVVDSVTSGNIFGVRLGANYILQGGLSVGTHTATGTANGSVLSIMGNPDFAGIISSISIKELTQETPDISGNDNNAILKTGKALVFDGSNDGVDISNFSMSGSEGTFAFWYKPQTATDLRYVIDLAESGDGRFIIGNQNNKFKVFTQTGGTGGNWTISDDYVVSLNEWQRVVVTIDSSKNLKIYKNGVQLGSTQTSVTNLNIDNVSAAYIGQGHGGSGSNVIDGSLSDFQIYNKVWSDGDVTYDYKNPQNLVTDNVSSDVHLRNLKAWWHLSEGSGSVIHDSAPLIGKELLVNGDFSDASTGWQSSGSDWTFSNNSAIYVGDGSANELLQNINFVGGKLYKIVIDVASISGTLKVRFNNDQANKVTFNTVGENIIYITTSGTGLINNDISISRESGVVNSVINSLSIKEVFNIDGDSYDDDTNVDGTLLGADWEHSQERIPQLGMMNWSKGSNVLTYSNDFQASPWTSAYVILDEGYEAPDGTMTAWKLTRDGALGFGAVYDLTVTPNIGVVRSIYAKTVSGTGNVHLMNYNTNSNSLITVTNEWQRFSISSAPANAGIFYAVDFRGSSTLTEVIIWGAQEEVNVGDSLSAFRKTNGLAVTNSTLIKTPDVEQFTGNKVTRNLILYSEDFNNSYWDGRQNLTIESGYADPNGGNSAYKVTANETYANLLHDFSSGIQNYSRSIWAKAVSGSGTLSLLSRFNSSNSIQTITNEWQRFDVSSDDGGDPNSFYAIDFRGSSTLTEVLIYGAQLQEGTLTRYFPTYGAVAQETLPIIGKDILNNDVETRGGTLNLDGTGYAEVLDDSAFDIPACNNVDEGGFTLSAWVKAKYVNKTSGANVVSTLGGDITQAASGGICVFSDKIGAYINAAQLQADNTFIEGNWYYVVTTRSVSGICKLYIDTNAQIDTDYTLGSITNSNNKMVGRDSLPYQRFYEERIDDVKFYNRELSSDEIEQNYNATKSAHTN